MELVPPFQQRVNDRAARGDNEAFEHEFARVLENLELYKEAQRPFVEKPLKDAYDVVIVGSGPGGGTMAHALRASGKSVLLLEQGPFLPNEPENWNSTEVLSKQRYHNSEEWIDGSSGRSFQPNMYYYVGGMTKLYASTLVRYRAEDFGEQTHEGGLSPAWPVTYQEMEPYYADAERLYYVHGAAGEDPTEAPRSGAFPYPAAPKAPEILELKERLEAVGLHPYSVPQGMALMSGGRCIYCAYCDMHPCRVLAKSDPELCCIRPAIAQAEVTLAANTRAERLLTDDSGRRVVAVEVMHEGQPRTIRGGTFIVSGGAVNTPALLLRSASDRHPDGLANSSGLVGANYMRHNTTMVLAQVPGKHALPQDHYWKVMGFNDYYLKGDSGEWPFPMGTVQLTGNYHEWMHNLLPDDVGGGSLEARQELAAQMLPLFLLSEDLPATANRVSLDGQKRIKLTYDATNVPTHERFIRVVTQKLKDAGYGTITHKSFLRITDGGGYHHCGTTRFGNDPATSVLDRNCKAHDVDNLYVVDTCCFPSNPALNPVLTIIANALRVAEHIKSTL